MKCKQVMRRVDYLQNHHPEEAGRLLEAIVREFEKEFQSELFTKEVLKLEAKLKSDTP